MRARGAHLLDPPRRRSPRRWAASRNRGLGPWKYVGIDVPFEGGWDNSGSVDSPVRFRIDDFGIVHITGGAVTLDSGRHVFTLPSGHRPAYRSVFVALAGAINNPIRVDVRASGTVKTHTGVLAADHVVFEDLQFRKAPSPVGPGAPAPEALYPAPDLYPSPNLYPGSL